MVFAVINSFVCLMWSFILILFMIYLFAIVIQNGVADYFKNAETEEEMDNARAVQVSFGSLYETMVSLFSAISGGNDWMYYGELLRSIGPGDTYLIIFIFYIAFYSVGLLNVVTGIFVDSAISTRTEDEIVDGYRDEQARISNEVRKMFVQADLDRSDSLTLEEFEEFMKDEWVCDYFCALGLDPKDALFIFKLLDEDNDNEIMIDEFVNGTLRLKGGAKCVDSLALMYDSAKYIESFNTLCDHIATQLSAILELVHPEHELVTGLNLQEGPGISYRQPLCGLKFDHCT